MGGKRPANIRHTFREVPPPPPPPPEIITSHTLYGDCLPADRRRSDPERLAELGMKVREPGKDANLEQTLAEWVRHNMHLATGDRNRLLKDARTVLAANSMIVREEVWKRNHVMFMAAPWLARKIQQALRTPEDLEQVIQELEELGPDKAARKFRAGAVMQGVMMACAGIKGTQWEKRRGRMVARAQTQKYGPAKAFITTNAQPDQDGAMLRYACPLGHDAAPFTKDLLAMASAEDGGGPGARSWATVDTTRTIPPLPDARSRMAITRERFADVNEVTYERFQAFDEICHAMNPYDPARESCVGADGSIHDFLRGCGMEGYLEYAAKGAECSRKGIHTHYRPCACRSPPLQPAGGVGGAISWLQGSNPVSPYLEGAPPASTPKLGGTTYGGTTVTPLVQCLLGRPARLAGHPRAGPGGEGADRGVPAIAPVAPGARAGAGGRVGRPAGAAGAPACAARR